MVHTSTQLAFCWHFAQFLEESQVLIASGKAGKDESSGGRSSSFKANRRQKFREQGGPSREALQRSHIVSILRTIPVLQNVHPHLPPGSFEPLSLSSLNPLPQLKIPPNGCYDDGNSNDGTASMSESMEGFISGSKGPRELPQDVMWPLSAISELGGDQVLAIDWDAMPTSADPMRGLGYKAAACGMESSKPRAQHSQQKRKHAKRNEVGKKCGHDEEDEKEGGLGRGERKRSQVGSIATALKSFNLPAGSVVVDFGCGSGALSLPLACLFPHFTFVCVDYKQESIRLLGQRAEAAKLTNVITWQGRIEDYTEPFDACVALHACGNATDLALVQALKWRAAYVVSPCCVGKLQFAVPAPSSLHSRLQTSKESTAGRAAEDGYVFIDLINPKTLSVQEQNGEDFASATTTLKNSSSSGDEHESSAYQTGSIASTHKKLVESNIGVAATSQQLIEKHLHITSPECESQENPQRGDQTLTRELPLEISLAYPRSGWLQSAITPTDFLLLARTADWSSYDHESWTSRLHSLCKAVVELDRNQASQELGYRTVLLSLADEKAGAVGVGHVLVGKPFHI